MERGNLERGEGGDIQVGLGLEWVVGELCK